MKIRINQLSKYTPECSTYLHFARAIWGEISKELTDSEKVRIRVQEKWNELHVKYKDVYNNLNNKCIACNEFNFINDTDDAEGLYHNKLILQYINSNKNENCSVDEHYIRVLFDEFTVKMKSDNPDVSRGEILSELKKSFNLLSNNELKQWSCISEYCIKCSRKL